MLRCRRRQVLLRLLRMERRSPGLPLSGLIFALAVDPFLCQLVAEAEASGAAAVRACADDIGATLRGFRPYQS